jgi:hypothetical protein
MVRTKETQNCELNNQYSPYVRFTLPNLNAPKAIHQGPVFGLPPILLTRDPINQRLLTVEIWKQLNAFLPTDKRCNTPYEFCDHLGIRHGEYYNSSGRKTPCLYWCTTDKQYAKYITEALVPPGRADVRSLTIFGDLDIHLALFAAKTDKTTKDAIVL